MIFSLADRPRDQRDKTFPTNALQNRAQPESGQLLVVHGERSLRGRALPTVADAGAEDIQNVHNSIEHSSEQPGSRETITTRARCC